VRSIWEFQYFIFYPSPFNSWYSSNAAIHPHIVERGWTRDTLRSRTLKLCKCSPTNYSYYAPLRKHFLKFLLEWLPFQRPLPNSMIPNLFFPSTFMELGEFLTHLFPPHYYYFRTPFTLYLFASNPYVEYRTPRNIFPVDCIEMFYYHSATLVELPQKYSTRYCGQVSTFDYKWWN